MTLSCSLPHAEATVPLLWYGAHIAGIFPISIKHWPFPGTPASSFTRRCHCRKKLICNGFVQDKSQTSEWPAESRSHSCTTLAKLIISVRSYSCHHQMTETICRKSAVVSSSRNSSTDRNCLSTPQQRCFWRDHGTVPFFRAPSLIQNWHILVANEHYPYTIQQIDLCLLSRSAANSDGVVGPSIWRQDGQTRQE